MEAELEKDLEDDVIPVPSETDDLDDDPELEALTKIAERNATQVGNSNFQPRLFSSGTFIPNFRG